MAYGDFKDLPRRTASDKLLPDKEFNVAKNQKYDGYQRSLASMVYTFCNKKSDSLADKSAKGSDFKFAIKQNEQLAEGLHKLIIRRFEKRKIYSSSKDSICDANLEDIL